VKIFAKVHFLLAVALLWGSADILAALAARRLRTFKTTFVSQSIGLLALLAFGAFAFWLWHLPFTLTALVLSALIGIFTGLCAALGYFAFYRSLEIGPIAIVSPITATSSTFTLILSTLILQEQLTIGRMGFVTIVILGIVLASTSITELRALLHKPGYSLWSQGVRWAIVATLAFGAMDFGIGASASVSGWFLPVLWTRFFSILFLTLISYWKHCQRQSRAHITGVPSSTGRTLSLSLPSLEEIAHVRNPLASKIGLGVLLAIIAGITENAAVLTFSLDTRIATTGITSAIASSYALVVMVFGMLVYRERLAKNQLFGIAVFMVGLVLLAL
jgi:drug/metabolite transporter (DMT)-like permease